ncbi:MAG TPA: zinc-ribbon domain-containing protein, partial [Ktedonobacteraceae bacterium]
MQCPTCGATLPDGTSYCYNCGTRVAETTSPAPEANAEVHETPPPVAPPVLVGGEPYQEAGWIEFGGGQVSPALPASTEATYPPASPVPGTSGYSYGPSVYYPYPPNSLSPYSVQPFAPAPKRRGRTVIITIVASLVALLVIFGSVYAGIQIGQSHGSANSTHAATAMT